MPNANHVLHGGVARKCGGSSNYTLHERYENGMAKFITGLSGLTGAIVDITGR